MFTSHEGDGDRIGFDMVFLMLMGFVLIVMILIQFIADKKPSDQSVQQGNVIVELYWPDEADSDIDLWVKAPQDIPVGYSNKGGIVFNLLRDDLGIGQNDVSGRNMEIATSRGVIPGEYIINVHLFRLGGAELPMKTKVVVSVKKDDKSASQQLFGVDVALTRECQEKTAIIFQLTGAGELIEESVHFTQKNIRSSAGCSYGGGRLR